MRKLARAALSLVLLLGIAPAHAADPTTVFAAASLKNALDEAGKAFTAQSGLPVRASYAASSVLARQIEQGAPADLFASADLEWMDYLAARKLIRPETRVNLLNWDCPVSVDGYGAWLSRVSVAGFGRCSCS